MDFPYLYDQSLHRQSGTETCASAKQAHYANTLFLQTSEGNGSFSHEKNRLLARRVQPPSVEAGDSGSGQRQVVDKGLPKRKLRDCLQQAMKNCHGRRLFYWRVA
mmetsp:Transcript_8965/g.55133  ORF Transcript_8965/g.55133 Transcript_8965/m.55133 type:complete len:105 (-) Transcript_8965:1723-2037(-)